MMTWKKTWQAALAMTLALPLTLTTVSHPAQAEGPNDPAPYINAKVVNGNAGKKVLFDNTHGQTAGAADWVIDGAFSDFGNALANNGYYVKELRKTTPLTLTDLEAYDAFIIPEANIPYKASEQQAMLDYVKGGGAIFFISDHYNADRNKNRWDSSEVFNGYRRGAWTNPAKGMSTEEAGSAAMQGVVSSDWLGTNFGFRFRYNALGDVNATQIVPSSQAFGITTGVSSVAMHAGSTAAILDPKKAKGIVYLPATTAKWANAVDQGVYNGGSIAEGPYAGVSKVGLGKAAFIGDSSPVEDATPKYLREETGTTKRTYAGWSEQNDATLLLNMVNWLTKDESYTSFDQVTGLTLDQPTALYSWELPANSTEPQAEPWSAPATGYKWWDMSTFKSGSYGYGSGTGGGGTPTDPTAPTGYSFVHQATLPNQYVFPVKIRLAGQTPNTTFSTLNLGVYNSSGTQIAKVQIDNGLWPSSYGYSSNFSLTTDASGYAEKTVNMQLNPNYTGAANMRIRQGTTAKFTEAVQVGNVAVQTIK